MASTGRIVLHSNSSQRSARIMIVDDERANLDMLCEVLQRGGYESVRAFSDPRQARAAFREWRPDLLLLDLHMPGLSGFELAAQLQEDADGELAPIIVLTADATADIKRQSLAGIAHDHIVKPFDVSEALIRIENVLTTHLEKTRLRDESRALEERIRTDARVLEAARLETLERLALAAEYRDNQSQEHAWRVGRTAALLARALAVPGDEAGAIGRGAVLHDVGKIGIADNILLKPGALDSGERIEMEEHTVIGASILAGSSSSVLQVGEVIARSHHERWDGRGYPHGTEGEDTPLAGRIVAVADVFDALTHDRPYKGAWTVDSARREILDGAGSQFDPDVVDCFAELDADELLTPVDDRVSLLH
jgi:putative two-component system response regulator